MEVALVTFNAILKYQRISGIFFVIFQPLSRTIMSSEMTLVHLWKHTLRKRGIFLNLRDCLYRAVSWKMEQSLHSCCSFIWIMGWFRKIIRLVQHTPMNCFNNFVYSAENARREGNENLNSNVGETMKLLANNSHGYQITDRS